MEQILPTNEGVEKKQNNTVEVNLNIFIKAYNGSTGSEIQILHQSFKYLVHCNFYLINNLCEIYIASKAYPKLRGWCIQDTADLEQCGQMALSML